MSQQIQQAVDIANSLTADASLKKQALDFLQQMKESDEAVQLFTSCLRDSQSNTLSKFVALQVLCELVPQSDKEHLIFLKEASLTFLGDNLQKNIEDPEYIKNKTAELFSQLFYFMYGDINGNLWSSFFSDMFQLTNISNLMSIESSDYSLLGLDYFLRICSAINSNIGDQTFVRSKNIQIKNNSLKDAAREYDIVPVTKLWLNALKTLLQQTHPEKYGLACLVLSCIGSYISWIDINLITTNEYISTIYNYLNYSQTRIACSQCLCEVISKKMKPANKLELLSMMNLTDKVLEINDDDIDVCEEIAKLTSSIGYELCNILDHCNDSNGSVDLQAIGTAADHQIINIIVPLVLKFVAHEYDSVSQQCFQFITQYLSFLKKLFALGGKPGSIVAINSKKLPLDEDHRNFLTSLIIVCMKKIEIDETCNEEDVDEIEEFVETIRLKLKVFQDNIAVINPSIYLDNIVKHIESLIIANNWRKLEACLFQMHNFAESIKNNLFGFNKAEITTSRPYGVMCEFMKILINNGTIFQMNNSLIQISFFELVVKHYNFLGTSNKDETTLLNIFCSEFGMFNNKENVRLRTWYLFSRFIKITKPCLTSSILSQFLLKLSPLLVIKAQHSTGTGDDVDTTFDNQLYLFEGVGMLVGINSNTNYEILDAILTPLFSDLESCIAAPIKSPEVVLQTHHILVCIGTVVRGLHTGLVPEHQVNNASVSDKLVHKSLIEKFSNIAEVLLVTFSYFNKYETIRDASRFSFARLTPILNTQVIPFTNRLISIFLNSDLKTIEMSDFLGFLGQMIHMFKSDEENYQLFNNLLTPLIKKIFELVCDNNQGSIINGSLESITTSSKVSNTKNVVITDSFRDKITLKKSYYAFLQSFITNNVTSLLLTKENRDILPIILIDLLTYSPSEIHETSSMKLSMNVLVNFVKRIGTGSCIDTKDINAHGFEKLEGLSEFFISKSVPLVFEIPFKAEYSFNIQDGSCHIVACDLSRLLKTLYYINGSMDSNACLKYLTDVYFPQVQFPEQVAMEFVQALTTLDEKQFEKYFVGFITNMKS